MKIGFLAVRVNKRELLYFKSLTRCRFVSFNRTVFCFCVLVSGYMLTGKLSMIAAIERYNVEIIT